MQLNLKHEIIHNENKANVYCDTAYQCIIHAIGHTHGHGNGEDLNAGGGIIDFE